MQPKLIFDLNSITETYLSKASPIINNQVEKQHSHICHHPQKSEIMFVKANNTIELI